MKQILFSLLGMFLFGNSTSFAQYEYNQFQVCNLSADNDHAIVPIPMDSNACNGPRSEEMTLFANRDSSTLKMYMQSSNEEGTRLVLPEVPITPTTQAWILSATQENIHIVLFEEGKASTTWIWFKGYGWVTRELIE